MTDQNFVEDAESVEKDFITLKTLLEKQTTCKSNGRVDALLKSGRP